MKKIIVIDNDSIYFNRIKESLKKFCEIEDCEILLCNTKNFQSYLNKKEENVLGFFVNCVLEDISQVFQAFKPPFKEYIICRPCVVGNWRLLPKETLKTISGMMDTVAEEGFNEDAHIKADENTFHREVVTIALEWAGYAIHAVPCNVPVERYL